MLAKYRQDQLHQACSTNAYLGLKNDETFRGQKVRVTNSLVQGKMYRGFRNEISLSPKMRDWRLRQPMKISKDITRTKNRRQPSLLPFVAVSANSLSAAFCIWLIRLWKSVRDIPILSYNPDMPYRYPISAIPDLKRWELAVKAGGTSSA